MQKLQRPLSDASLFSLLLFHSSCGTMVKEKYFQKQA